MCAERGCPPQRASAVADVVVNAVTGRPCLQAAVALYMQLGFCDSYDGACLVEPPVGPHRKTLMKELCANEEERS